MSSSHPLVVVTEHVPPTAGGFRVGLVTEGLPGYQLLDYGPFPSQQQASEFAARFNQRLGRSPDEVLEIIGSSMFPTNPNRKD